MGLNTALHGDDQELKARYELICPHCLRKTKESTLRNLYRVVQVTCPFCDGEIVIEDLRDTPFLRKII